MFKGNKSSHKIKKKTWDNGQSNGILPCSMGFSKFHVFVIKLQNIIDYSKISNDLLNPMYFCTYWLCT